MFLNFGNTFDLILTACSATEADVWRTELEFAIKTAASVTTSSPGASFGLLNEFINIPANDDEHLGSCSTDSLDDFTQVVIKHTCAVKEMSHSLSTSITTLPPNLNRPLVSRSSSVAIESRVVQLAPARSERIRLENLAADVWTIDKLPFPGMISRITDPLRRLQDGAGGVVRKLSMASIASSVSLMSRKEDLPPRPCSVKSGRAASKQRQVSKPMSYQSVIDFHTAPEAFLPADFEISVTPGPGTTSRKKKTKLNAFNEMTNSYRRPASSLTVLEKSRRIPTDEYGTAHRRSHSSLGNKQCAMSMNVHKDSTDRITGHANEDSPTHHDQRGVVQPQVEHQMKTYAGNPPSAHRSLSSHLGESSPTNKNRTPIKNKVSRRILRMFG